MTTTKTTKTGTASTPSPSDYNDFGHPTTGTTSTPSPPIYYYPPSPTSRAPFAPNISDRLPSSQTAGNSQPRHPRVAEWKNGVAPTDRSKPCASDYCDDAKRCILKACGRYEVFIVTEEAFPDHDTQLTKAREFFVEACKTFGVEYQVTDRILGVVSTIPFLVQV